MGIWKLQYIDIQINAMNWEICESSYYDEIVKTPDMQINKA